MSEQAKTKLYEVVSSGNGVIQTGPFGSQLHASDYVKEGIPCIMPVNLKNNRIVLDRIARISSIDASRLSKHLVKEGDIIFSRRGDITQKALITRNEEGFFCGTGCLLLRPGNQIDSKFLIYKLSEPTNISWLKNHAVGITMPNINTKILGSIPLNIPSKSDQSKIASILSSLDEKIDLNNKINIELEQMAKTLYDYWFVQFNFPNAKGKPYKSSGGKMVYNEVLKRDVPAGWEVKKLQEIVYANRNQIDAKTSWSFINYLDTSNITDNHIKDIVTLDFTKIPSRAKRIVEINDVIFSTVRPNQRHFGILKNPVINMVVSTGFTVLSHRSNKIYNNFIYQFLSSDSIVSYLHGIAQNSVSSYPSINPDDILSLSLCIPGTSDKILDKISKELDVIYQKVSLNQKQNKELAAFRDWLLPMLMNGQANVTGEYIQAKNALSVTVESDPKYQKSSQLSIPDNKKGFAKQVLAGKIISLFRNDSHFTDIKFQKIQFLAEHIIQADLNLNYYYQAAGPYDNVFMHTIYNDFKKNKWYDCKDRKFTALEMQAKIEDYYQNYFGPAVGQLNKLFRLLSGATEAKSEIIATIYAVWNNFIIEGRRINDNELVQSFYNWSERKHQYTEAQVMEGLQWLRENKLEPNGFGKMIKKAKSKK